MNDELARAKISAGEIATRIHANMKTLQASGLVVHDAAALVLKAPDDLAAIIANRVTAEQARLEAERERIRQEEAAKLPREEEQARLDVERKCIRFEELHRQQQETAAQAQAELERQRDAEESAENEQNQAVALTQQAQAAIETVAPPADNVVPMRAAPVPTSAPSIREQLNNLLEQLGEPELRRVLSFVQSRFGMESA